MSNTEQRWRDIVFTVIPVLVGAAIAAATSLLVLHYTTEATRKEARRKERIERIERATMLGARLLRELNSALASNVVNRYRGMTTEDVRIVAAPADTLVELETVIRLYIPNLAPDVDAVRRAYHDFASTADALNATEFASADYTTDAKALAEHEMEFRKKIEPLAKPVVDQMYKLLDRLRDVATKTSNQAMQLTVPHSVSSRAIAITFNLQPRALSGAVADLVSR